MADDFRSCLAGRLVGAHQYSPTQLASRWLRRPWIPIALAIALVLVTATAALWIGRLHAQIARLR